MLPFLCFRQAILLKDFPTPAVMAMATNFDSAVSEYGNAGHGYVDASSVYYVVDESTQVNEEDLEPVEPTREASTQVNEEDLEPVEPTREATTQVNEEDLDPVEPTREATTQVNEEDLDPVEPTREASTQVSEEDLEPVEPTPEASYQISDDDLPLLIAGRHGYENCLESDASFQNQASHDFDQYTNANPNRLAHSNTNEGEFQNQSHDICSAANALGVMDDQPASYKQTYVCEQSSVGEGENENSSNELLRRQGPKKPTERGIKSGSLALTDSITLESKYPAENLLSDSSEKIEGRQDRGNIPTPFSSFPQRNAFISKCFEENSVRALSVEKQTPKSTDKFSKRKYGKCKIYFLKKSTFYAHFQGNCNMRKRCKCKKCGKIFPSLGKFLLHSRVHTEEKPFKCTQCDYASGLPHLLKEHIKKHTINPPSVSSLLRRNPSVNKHFQDNLVTSKILENNPQSYNKFQKLSCTKCNKYFFKETSFIAHVQSNCHPRPFKCGQCSERFSMLNELRLHERVHKKEKPFKCTQCDYATKWPHDLKTHLKTKHNDLHKK